MIYLNDLITKIYLFLRCKTVADKDAVSPLAEIIEQDILSLHGLYVIRKIIKDIVINPCIKEPYDRGNQENKSKNENHITHPYYSLSKPDHCYNHPFYIFDHRSLLF